MNLSAHASTRPSSGPLWRRIVFWIWMVVNVLLTLITIMSAYGGTVNPQTSALPGILALMFPVFVGATLLTLAINFIWCRKAIWINGFSILMILGPISTYCPLNVFRPSVKELEADSANVFKVMTYNVYGMLPFENGESKEGNQTLQTILEADADIVILQEAGSIFWEGSFGRSESQHRLLERRYPYHSVDGRGIAVLSKYPYREIAVENPDPYQLDLNRYDMDVMGKELTIFNVHMQSIGLTRSDRDLFLQITEGETSEDEMDHIKASLLTKLASAFRSRAKQAEVVRGALDSVKGNVLLCGDFNDVPGSYAFRTVEGDDMTDAYRHAAVGPAITYHADRLYFRIDQMLYRGNLDALRVDALHRPDSDHYPLVGYFKFTRPRKE